MTSRSANQIHTHGVAVPSIIQPPSGSSQRQATDGRAGLHARRQHRSDPARNKKIRLNVVLPILTALVRIVLANGQATVTDGELNLNAAGHRPASRFWSRAAASGS